MSDVFDHELSITPFVQQLHAWATAPWWRRWWVRWRLQWRLRTMVLTLVSYAEDLDHDFQDLEGRNSQLYCGLQALMERLQGMTSQVRTLIVPKQQDRFVAAMHEAIDIANAAVGPGAPRWAKIQASTATTPLACRHCGRSSTTPGLRFFQDSAGVVTCFPCLGITNAPPRTDQ